MVLFMALILVMIGASIMTGVYSVIQPFTNELGNIQRYNQAYYGAIAGIERAELTLRGHTAGFEGSGGWINKSTYGNESDYKNIVTKQYFGFLALTGNGNGSFWQVKSMTNGVVPEAGKGNLDSDISSGNNYEKLTFDHALQYALYKDISPKSDYYTGVSDSNISNIKIDTKLIVRIRTPFKLTKEYNNGTDLDRNNTRTLLNKDNADLDGDGIDDDIVVNRSLFGYTGDTAFTIFPSINLNSDGTGVASNDTAIREDVINSYVNSKDNVVYETTNKDTNPCAGGTHTQNVSEFNQSPDNAVSTGFDIVLGSTSSTKKMALKLSLVNLLKYDTDHVYPYLEVQVESNTTNPELPDLNFHIMGEGKVKDYDVKILISKPVFDTTAASDFTVLF